jgi:two-component system chemotaxis response regulator CheY
MKNVLVVDDAVFMRHSIKQMLIKNNYNVVGEANNGVNAIYKYNELRPDIVTMDITMDEMDGLEALKVIKQMDPQAKVVMISALGQESMVRDAIVYGAQGFLVKPFKEEDVIKVLDRL